MSNSIYDFISLYDFIIKSVTPLLAIATQNTAIAMVAVVVYISHLSVTFFKSYGYKGVDYLNNTFRLKSSTDNTINDRPSEAFNCNIINKGGDYSGKPGFPSGHTTTASVIYFILLLEYFDKNNTYKQRQNLIGVLIVTLILMLLTCLARVKSKCHTIPQVISGVILGLIIAIIYKIFEKNVLMKSERFVKDKERLLNFF